MGEAFDRGVSFFYVAEHAVDHFCLPKTDNGLLNNVERSNNNNDGHDAMRYVIND